MPLFTVPIAVPLALLSGVAAPPPPDPIGQPPPGRPTPKRANLERGAKAWTRWYWRTFAEESGVKVNVSGLAATCGPSGSDADRRWRCFVTYSIAARYSDGTSETARVIDVHRACFASKRIREHGLFEPPAASGQDSGSDVLAPGGISLDSCLFAGYVIGEG